MKSLRAMLVGSATLLALLVGLLANVGTARAATSAIIDNCDPTKMTQLQFVQCVGNTEITRRINYLNDLSTKTQSLIAFINQKAPNSQITTDLQGIVNDANANINGGTTFGTQVNGLNALKTTLDGETTVQAARADIQTIYKGYRIYALVLPRDYNQKRFFHLQWAYGVIEQLISQFSVFSGTPTPSQPTCPPDDGARTVQALMACANQYLTQESSLYSSSTLQLANYNETNIDQTIKQLHQDSNSAEHYLNAATILINNVCNKTSGCTTNTPAPTPAP